MAGTTDIGDGGSGLEPLDAVIDDYVQRLSGPERRKLGMRIAVDLRAANAARIGEQVDPDGKAFVPRKKARSRRQRDKITGLKRRTKAKKMFLRARGTRYLRKESTTGEARVGFVGAMARIMRVHQEGLTDTVTRDPSSPTAKYPKRRVLGISEADRLHILEQVAGHLE